MLVRLQVRYPLRVFHVNDDIFLLLLFDILFFHTQLFKLMYPYIHKYFKAVCERKMAITW